MFLTLFALFALYLGCFGLFHADPGRSGLAYVKNNPGIQNRIRSVSLVAILLALYAFCDLIGAERGIPVWMGSTTLAAVSNLLIAALLPKPHTYTGGVALGGATICAASTLIAPSF